MLWPASQEAVGFLWEKKKSTDNPNQEEHSEEEEENWNLPADRREDILLALDLLADHLSRDAPLEYALTQHNTVEENIDVDTEEIVDAIPEGQDTEQIQQLPKDTVAHTGLEGGELPSTTQSQSSAEPVCNHPARRQVKPVVRLSYDRPGHSTNEPIVVVHRGLRITIQRGSPLLCQSWDNVSWHKHLFMTVAYMPDIDIDIPDVTDVNLCDEDINTF